MSGPFVLVPIDIVDSTLVSSTAAEPSASETVWNAATNYVQGQKAIRVSKHRVYENIIPGVNATPPEDTLGDTLPRWIDRGPTNRWAALDNLINTATAVVTPLTNVYKPKLFNSIAMYGLIGSTATVSIKDFTGGSIVFNQSYSLLEVPIDHYDYYFGPIKQLTKAFIKGLVPYADPEVTISVTAGLGITVKKGLVVFGDLRKLVTIDGRGGTQHGSQARPTTYSYIKFDDFGTAKIVERDGATDLDLKVLIPGDDADSALLTLQQVLDKPAAWIGSDVPGFSGLNVYGLASGSMSYDEGRSYMSIQVRGFI
jgi:hypothetical protein